MFDWEVSDGWQQGRGAFGGLTVAALVRAVEHVEPRRDRRLRSLSVQLPGATVLGPAEIRVETLRASSGQSTLSAALSQDGEVRAFAVAVLAKDRPADADEYCELAAPELGDWRTLEPLPGGVLGPVFARHFEYRCTGPLPFSSGPEAVVEGFVRLPNTNARDVGDAAYLAALADAWWPATFSRMTAPRPIGTVAFTLQVLGSARELDPSVPLAYRARTWVQTAGWLVEQRELWSEAGQLLALNQQTIAIIV